MQPAARKMRTAAKARLTAKLSITVWLEGLVCLLRGRAVMKSKTNWCSLGCRSIHVCPCCPRTARFFRENSLVCWERFPHFCGARLFSVTAVVCLWSHTRHSKPACYYNTKPEGAETEPQPTSGLHDYGWTENPVYLVKSWLLFSVF